MCSVPAIRCAVNSKHFLQGEAKKKYWLSVPIIKYSCNARDLFLHSAPRYRSLNRLK